MSIATAKNSVAEVQFENDSTLRLGDLSRVDFTEMALAPRGARVDRLTLAFGLATANVAPGRHDEYVLRAADATLTRTAKLNSASIWTTAACASNSFAATLRRRIQINPKNCARTRCWPTTILPVPPSR